MVDKRPLAEKRHTGRSCFRMTTPFSAQCSPPACSVCFIGEMTFPDNAHLQNQRKFSRRASMIMSLSQIFASGTQVGHSLKASHLFLPFPTSSHLRLSSRNCSTVPSVFFFLRRLNASLRRYNTCHPGDPKQVNYSRCWPEALVTMARRHHF